MGRREKRPRGAIDTSVLIAGIAGWKTGSVEMNASALLLRDWIENRTFRWLVTEEILSEYKEVPTRLGVRRNLAGEIVNMLREEADFVTLQGKVEISPDPDDDAFCACAEHGGAAFIATLNRRHFPQMKLAAKVISPGDPIPTTRPRRKL